MSERLLPANLASVLPALVAMFAISMTFSLYNYALFQAVMENGWSNTLITLIYNGNFVFCVLGLVGLLFRPMLALSRPLMMGCSVLTAVGATFLFWNATSKEAWFLFFILEGAVSVVWHQNVRLTLIERAQTDEYARVFSLYMISHIAGNVLGGLIFNALQDIWLVWGALMLCYAIGGGSLFFYSRRPEEQPFQGASVQTLKRFKRLLQLNPTVWVVVLAAGYMGETFFNFLVSYLNRVGFASQLALSALAAFQIGAVLFKYPTATLMDRCGLWRTTACVLAVGVCLMGGLWSVSGLSDYSLLCFAAVLGGVLCSLTIVGDTVVTTVLPKRDHQEAVTFSILVYFLGGLIGNSLVGPAMDYLNASTFPVITVCVMGVMFFGMLGNRMQIAASRKQAPVST